MYCKEKPAAMNTHICVSLLLLGVVLSPGLCESNESTAASQATTTKLPTTVVSTINATSPSDSENTTVSGNGTSSTSSVVSTPINGTTTTAQVSPSASSASTSTSTAAPTTASANANVSDTTAGQTESSNTTVANATATTSVVTTMSTVPDNVTATSSVNTTVSSSTTSSNVSSSSTTASSSAATSAPAGPASTSVPVATDVVISETNLLLADGDFFVELKGSPNENLSGLTVAAFNGISASEKWKMNLDSNATLSSAGFFIQPMDSSEVKSLTSVVLALYQTKDYTGKLQDQGLQDFAVFSADPSATMAGSVEENLLRGDALTIVKKGLVASQNLSLSRCGPDSRSANLFVLVGESRGETNPCNLTANTSPWTLRMHRQDNICQQAELNDSQQRAVGNALVEEINRRCQCAFTTLLMDGKLSCARDLFWDFTIKESYQGQGQRVTSAFVSFTKDNGTLTVDHQVYSVVNCSTSCRDKSHPKPPGGSKANTSVTVAVVLSCVAVFLIVLVSVILYMRSKRKGIIRQFRMTRLQEDDDMDDMDDFIGSGGEASFSRSSR